MQTVLRVARHKVAKGAHTTSLPETGEKEKEFVADGRYAAEKARKLAQGITWPPNPRPAASNYPG